ncbi:MAG: dCTP deaminase [Candidatus Omnitrophica bacterium]|nr:dCTP deaminase [Candidatus Omnitrophota bacterium]
MRTCTGEYIAKYAEHILSEKHQVHEYSLDLSVNSVYAVKKAGDLDFGGSELKSANMEQVLPQKRSEEDKYGWWNLTSGEYIVEFNEKVVVPDNCIASIQPLSETLRAGVTHPSLTYSSGEQVEMTLLLVGKSGLHIKQNARISSLRAMTTE